MKTSIEISMYPLDRQYERPILAFIDRLREHDGITVTTNSMSTQLFGDYDRLLSALSREMKESFQEEPTVVMVMKIVNADLS